MFVIYPQGAPIKNNNSVGKIHYLITETDFSSNLQLPQKTIQAT